MSQSCNGCNTVDYAGELNEAGVCNECTSAPVESTEKDRAEDVRGYTWTGENPGIDDIAGPHFNTSEWRASMDKTLLSLTPETIVDDGNWQLSMRDLAREHSDSMLSDEGRRMSEHEAWGWACADLVFNGYEVRSTCSLKLTDR